MPETPLGPAESRREDTFLADHPGAVAIGEGPSRLETLDQNKQRKTHSQPWRADANHMRKWVFPAVDSGRPAQKRVKAWIRKAAGSCKVRDKHGRPAPRPRHGGLLARHPNGIAALDTVEIDVPGPAEKLQRLHSVAVATKFPRVYRVRATDGRSVVPGPISYFRAGGRSLRTAPRPNAARREGSNTCSPRPTPQLPTELSNGATGS